LLDYLTFRHSRCSPAFKLAQPQHSRDSSSAIVEEGLRGRRIVVVLGPNLWGSEGSLCRAMDCVVQCVEAAGLGDIWSARR